MASEQAITNEATAKTVAEITRVAIQAMAAATRERPQNPVGPKRWTYDEITKLQLGGTCQLK